MFTPPLSLPPVHLCKLCHGCLQLRLQTAQLFLQPSVDGLQFRNTFALPMRVLGECQQLGGGVGGLLVTGSQLQGQVGHL